MHPTLRYTWMRYLRKDAIVDEFWNGLATEIREALQESSVVWPWSESELLPPPRLRVVTPNFRDQYNEPLFDDLETELYLSKKYESRDAETLQVLGVKSISAKEMWRRIKADLRKPESKMKSEGTDKNWHTRVANLLKNILEKGSSDLKSLVKSSSLIPLQDSSWASATTVPIYFRTAGRVSIPSDLNLNFVAEPAASNNSRASFFRLMGVKDCSTQKVIDHIRKHYSSGKAPQPTSRSDSEYHDLRAKCSAEHLRFLFRHSKENLSPENIGIWLFDRFGRPVHLSGPNRKHIYFPDVWGLDNPKLLQRADHPFHYLHKAYLDIVPGFARARQEFEEWLEYWGGVRRYVSLRHPLKDEISEEFKYISENRSKSLLDIFKSNWREYSKNLKSFTPQAEAEVQKLKVHITNGKKAELRKTYAPFLSLKEIANSCGCREFPYFLKLSEGISEETEKEWSFLEALGVGVEDDLDFYLKCLEELKKRESAPSMGKNKPLMIIYKSLADRSIDTENKNFIR